MLDQGVEPSRKRLFKDRSQKKCFSYPEVVESLLRDFLAALLPGGSEWLKRLDFSSLERVPTEQVNKAFSARYADLLWRLRVRRRDGSRQWLHVLLLLEFQSTVDWIMALRVQEYAVEVFFSPQLLSARLFGRVGGGLVQSAWTADGLSFPINPQHRRSARRGLRCPARPATCGRSSQPVSFLQ